MLTLTLSIKLHAPVKKVWIALTKSEIVKQYFFNTQLDTTWKAGSPIYFRGSWNGNDYEDKGTVLKIISEKYIEYTYWSSFSGLPDAAQNYKTITYQLEQLSESWTQLTLTQDNNLDEKSVKQAEQHWQNVFDGLKRIVEQPNTYFFNNNDITKSETDSYIETKKSTSEKEVIAHTEHLNIKNK